MNRKQEAIEILRELATLDIMTDGYPPLSEYYDRIAPLMVREFPEEGIKALKRAEMFLDGLNFSDPPSKPHLCRYCPTKKYDSKVGISHFNSCLIVDLRNAIVLAETYSLRQPHLRPAEGDNILEQDDPDMKPEYDFSKGVRGRLIPKGSHLEQIDHNTFRVTKDKPKGICQTCGGNKRVPCPCRLLGCKSTVPCPDCKGTGECQHKGNQGWLDATNKTGPPKCLDCGEEVERRSGEERRKGKEIRCTAIPLFDTGQILPFGGYIRHNEIIPQGWHEDRRTQYVPDRRKAVSDSA